MVVEQSIFLSTKQMLDVAPGDDSFDSNILGHINAALSDLNDLGAGPDFGFSITGATEKWEDLDEDPVLTERIKNWIYLKVRLAWDPPQTSFLMEQHVKQIDEAGWRIVNSKDGEKWLLRHPQYIDADEPIILDGGDATS